MKHRIGYLLMTGGLAVGAATLIFASPSAGAAECEIKQSAACEVVGTAGCSVAVATDCSGYYCGVAVASTCSGCDYGVYSSCASPPPPPPTATPTAVADLLEILQDGGSN